MNGYIVSSFLWAVAGFASGFLIGHAVAAHFARDKETAVPSRALRADNIVGVMIIVLALVSVTSMGFTVRAQRAAVECQTEFNRVFSIALKERVDAAAQEREAQRQLLTTIRSDESSREAAIRRYIQQLNEADAQRDKHPLPLQPDCG